jgi:hypothetical protein
MNSNSVNCALCHVELLMPPLGKTAGLCPGLSCIQPAVLTRQRVRDSNLAANLILSGKMTAELEPETLVTWLTQVPLQAPKPQPIAYDDDGFARYRDPLSPHGQTVRPERDTLLGDDPRLAAYREAEEPSPETGYTVTVDDPPPGVEREAGE